MHNTMKLGGLVVAGVLVAGLGCADGASVRSWMELEAPVVAWTHAQLGGLCDRTRAVDGKRQLWSDQGCEGDDYEFTMMKTLEAPAHEELHTAVGGLPPADASNMSCATSSGHRFSFLETKDSVRRWTFCGGAEAGPNHLDGLPEPFLSVARVLDQP